MVYSKMNSKSKKRNKPPVLVVTCDAGGAEVIAAYVKKHAHERDFHSYVAGPAVRIFRRLKLPSHLIRDSRSEIARVVRAHAGSQYVLLGLPGWMTSIELRALTEAKEIGLKTIVYFDSWALYREVFGYPKRGWQKNLPDGIWVGDRYAYARVAKEFSHIPVCLVPNEYFKTETSRYRKMKHLRKADSILFTSTVGRDSHELLKHVLQVVARKKKSTCVRVRYHPADDRHRYDTLLHEYRPRVRIEESREKDIIRDLLHARVVVGTETVAMAVSILCGVRTFSLVKKGMHAMLPFKGIERIEMAGEIERLI